MFIFRLIRRVISFILLLIIAIPLYVAGSIWYSARNSEPVKSDVILVMGAAQFDGRPSDVLLARLKQTKIIFSDKVAPRIYTIGAGAPGDRTTEAAASRNWLIIVAFLQSNSLTITIVFQKYREFLQPYSHDRFSKISRTFCANRK